VCLVSNLAAEVGTMTRRSIVAAISIFVHAIVLFVLMTADLWRPVSEWPTPRSALAFVDEISHPVHLDDNPIAKPVRGESPDKTPPQITSLPIELAPISAPSGVAHETGGETSAAGPSPGLPGLESNTSDIGVIGAPTAPAPPPPAQAPIRLHSGIRAPQRVVNVAPVYPIIARNAHVEGLVIIEATIDEHGNVARTQVLRSIPLLDAAALDAVRQWKFSPTLLNGVPVPIVMTVTVNFTLD
jgi:protein TonB